MALNSEIQLEPSEIPKTSGFAGFNHSSPILSFIPAATSAE